MPNDNDDNGSSAAITAASIKVQGFTTNNPKLFLLDRSAIRNARHYGTTNEVLLLRLGSTGVRPQKNSGSSQGAADDDTV